VGSIILEAPEEEYEKCGFSLLPFHGILKIRALNHRSELMVSCSLNIGVWSPRGNFLIDPDEDGILVHIPLAGQSWTKPTNLQNRKLVNHGRWLVDVLYGLDKDSSKMVDKQIEDSFRMLSDKDGNLVIERRILHKFYQYRWPYALRVYQDGALDISLKKPIAPRLVASLKRLSIG
jgi:hypothetical protein